jgi:hypothetical protein
MTAALDVIAAFCNEQGIDCEIGTRTAVLTVPGTARQKITIVLSAGDKYLRVEAFVARHPDENAGEVHRWLLEQNARLLLVSFRVDRFGDVYLGGAFPVEWTTPATLDALLGIVVSTADGSFNTLLELGFRGAIEREWTWRTSRGLDAGNLEAFRHLFETD